MSEMLQIVCIALAFGFSLTLINRDKSEIALNVCSAINDALVEIVIIIIRIAPYAAFSLLVRVIAPFGLDILTALALYALTVVLGLSFAAFVVYPVAVRLIANISPVRYLSAIAPAQLMAFSTDSSSATLPVTLDCLENRLNISKDISGFVASVGATINMDGTALYQGVAALFIAQLYGIDLSLYQQLSIVATATLASIGAATVPGTGLVMLIIVMQGLSMPAHVVAGGLAVISGVDRILDMCRTTVNVTGDATVCSIIAHSEGDLHFDPRADFQNFEVR